MNLNFQIVPEHPDQIPEVTARVQAAGVELRGFVRALVAASVKEGRRVAEREAPRGDDVRNEGRRISDSIQTTSVRYSPGGAGGGGFYEADLYASGEIAPHLRYVFEGTADQGTGHILPARGNVLRFEKEGEGVKFRPWVRGQRPQTEWWDLAREAVEATLDAGIREMSLGKQQPHEP